MKSNRTEIKKYRINKYVKTYSDDSGGLIVNLYNGFIGLLSKSDNEKLQDYIVNGFVINENKYEDKLIGELIKNYIFVLENFDETKIILERIRTYEGSNQILNITIFVTQSCNMGCSYCFVEKNDNWSLDKNNMDKLLSSINNELEVGLVKKVKINWFGGEPLLELDKIEYFMTKLNEICLKYSVKIKSSLVTNGYYLTLNNFIKLLSIGINTIQVTFDGSERHHNKFRKTKEGHDTFSVIYHNLLKLKDNNYDFDLIIRCNYIKNDVDDGVDEFIYKYKKDFYSDNRFHLNLQPIIDYSTWGEKKAELSTYFGNVNYLIEKDRKHKIFKDVLYRILKPKYSWCSSELSNSFVIKWDGSISFCEETISDNTLNFYVQPFKSKDSIFNINHDQKLSGKCLNCSKLPICNGTCFLIKAKFNNNACVMQDKELEELIRYIYINR